MKPRRCALKPLNLSGRLTLGSRTYGWEEEGVGVDVDDMRGLTGDVWLPVLF